MKKLNKVARMYKSDKCHFVTELIDIIYPESQVKYVFTNTPETLSSDGNRIQNSTSQADASTLISFCIVMEFVDTDLDQILKHKIEFSERHLLKVLYSLVSSLSFVHECNVIHRDLKSANVLVSASC